MKKVFTLFAVALLAASLFAADTSSNSSTRPNAAHKATQSKAHKGGKKGKKGTKPKNELNPQPLPPRKTPTDSKTTPE